MSGTTRDSRNLVGGSLVPWLALGACALLLAPAVVAGVGAAKWLRARKLSWTWVLPACLSALALVLLTAPGAANRMGALAETFDSGDWSAGVVLGAGWVPWLAAAPVIAAWWRWRSGKDDLVHGGERERRARQAQGPLQVLATRRAWRRIATDGLLREHGVLLGSDDIGGPVRVARPEAHVTIVGATGAGKTTTAGVLLAAQVKAGGGLVVLDGKGGHELPHLLRELGEEHGRPVALWSPTPYCNPDLDALRVAWNPCSDGTPTEVKDRIASSEPQTEPYYAAIASRGLQATTRALRATGQPLRLDELTRLLDTPTELLTLLRALPDLAGEATWLGGLNDPERSALRGIATRLATMTGSEPGHWLLPQPDGLVLSHAVMQRWLVGFTLPQGTYPALVPHVGRYLMSALNAVAGRIETSGVQADTVVLVDELSAFDGEQLAGGLERGRSAGMRYVLATQSLSNFHTSGGAKLAAAALDNAELLIIHRQAEPLAVELLAGLGGTEEAWEHTHRVSDRHVATFGRDESGERARRLTARYRAHPDQIKQLQTGQAFVVETRPKHRVRKVQVRPVERSPAARERAA